MTLTVEERLARLEETLAEIVERLESEDSAIEQAHAEPWPGFAAYRKMRQQKRDALQSNQV